MCKSSDNKDQSPNREHGDRLHHETEDVGCLFRDFGQKYMKIYKPNAYQIKFIKDVSKCKTPAQGGIMIKCKKCENQTFLYKSCGNSQCPKCQSIKRIQWQDKIASKTLICPYQHIIFTLPHDLNYIARMYPKIVYASLFKAAWNTIEKLCKDDSNLGGTPGMTAVLHTFGSDLKHHIHLHTLVTFGGVDKTKKWVWPKRKNKLAPYRKIRNVFKDEYIKILIKELQTIDEVYYNQVSGIIKQIKQVGWCVHNTPPTTHTKVIEEYLGRYICRVGVSNKKVVYNRNEEQVRITYNDYKKQEVNKPAPTAIMHLEPLIAIHKIIQHVLPPNFQKVRYYGIMTTKRLKQIEVEIPELIKQNKVTVRTLMQIMNALIKQQKGLDQQEDESQLKCEKCQGTEFSTTILEPDNEWYQNNIRKHQVKNKSPDKNQPYNKPECPIYLMEKEIAMPKSTELAENLAV